MTKRIIWTSIVVLVIAGAGIYWYVHTETFADTKDRKAAFTVNAHDFIREFIENGEAANARYTDQIVVVNGRVSETEMADTTMNIIMDEPNSGSFIIFAFQQQYLAEAKTVKVGDSLSIKGSCSGGIFSEILEVHKIDFKRSTLESHYANTNKNVHTQNNQQ